MRMAESSIEKRIQKFFIRVILFSVLCIAVSLTISYSFTVKYNQMITNVENNNALRKVVVEELNNESWKIVNGMTEFNDGEQYTLLSEIYGGIDYLEKHSVMEDETKLELAKRTTKTLESYIDRLGEQTAHGARVDSMVETNEEIKNISIVVNDLLEEFSNEEIKVVAQLNKTIQTIQIILVVAIILIILAFIQSMNKTKNGLIEGIKVPLKSLEDMAKNIAMGDFDIRVDNVNVAELESLTSSLNIMAGKIETLIEENNREQENLKKAELSLLQAQITPHFLYNTYDTIIWLAEQGRKDDVVEVVKALTTFYRISLSKGNDWIAIEDEINHVESYLLIQRYRYGNILNYEINIEDDIRKTRILKLLLQPVVENAIYHGIKQVREKGKINIVAKRKEQYIYIKIADTGQGMNQEKLTNLKNRIYRNKVDNTSNKSSYGLHNVYKRIKLYYGEKSDMTIESKENLGTVVTLKLEYHINT